MLVIFIIMDYKNIHDNIINRAKKRKLVGYSENHHIIPKCMGGTNDKENLAIFTTKTHEEKISSRESGGGIFFIFTGGFLLLISGFVLHGFVVK